MTMFIYVIKDKVAEESGPIFEAKNDAVAQRKFRAVLAETSLAQHDFALLRVASIDHDNDIVGVEEKPVDVTNYTTQEVEE